MASSVKTCRWKVRFRSFHFKPQAPAKQREHRKLAPQEQLQKLQFWIQNLLRDWKESSTFRVRTGSRESAKRSNANYFIFKLELLGNINAWWIRKMQTAGASRLCWAKRPASWRFSTAGIWQDVLNYCACFSAVDLAIVARTGLWLFQLLFCGSTKSSPRTFTKCRRYERNMRRLSHLPDWVREDVPRQRVTFAQLPVSLKRKRFVFGAGSALDVPTWRPQRVFGILGPGERYWCRRESLSEKLENWKLNRSLSLGQLTASWTLKSFGCYFKAAVSLKLL